MMRSGNPALRSDAFTAAPAVDSAGAMSLQGAVNKTFILLLLTAAAAVSVWRSPAQFLPWLWPAAIIGFIVALVTIFRAQWAAYTAPAYALLEGLVLGGISAMMEQAYPGIVIQAIALTFGTLFTLLLAYTSGLIRPTQNFRLGVVAATGGIALVYFISIIMGFFGRSIPLIHQSGPIGIGFSLFVVVIAAFNLVLDFDYIERGAAGRAPKYLEWYAAFSLMVTLIWLYLEILRLLAKSRRR